MRTLTSIAKNDPYCPLTPNTTNTPLLCQVFSSRDMRIVSSNVYLLLLAISDSLYLTAVFSTNSLKTMQCLFEFSPHSDVNNHSQLMCKLLQFMLDLFRWVDFTSGSLTGLYTGFLGIFKWLIDAIRECFVIVLVLCVVMYIGYIVQINRRILCNCVRAFCI